MLSGSRIPTAQTKELSLPFGLFALNMTHHGQNVNIFWDSLVGYGAFDFGIVSVVLYLGRLDMRVKSWGKKDGPIMRSLQKSPGESRWFVRNAGVDRFEVPRPTLLGAWSLQVVILNS